jgi:hypothetical protein
MNAVVIQVYLKMLDLRVLFVKMCIFNRWILKPEPHSQGEVLKYVIVGTLALGHGVHLRNSIVPVQWKELGGNVQVLLLPGLLWPIRISTSPLTSVGPVLSVPQVWLGYSSHTKRTPMLIPN